MSALSNLFYSCNSDKPYNQTFKIPIKNIISTLPFPSDLVYQSSPDSGIIIGRKRLEPGIFEISAFNIDSAKELWKLPFRAELIGQTETQLLVYVEKTSSVYFIKPNNGEITRKTSPAPNPITSKSGHYLGMAFTDDLYLTTNGLYTTVIERGKIDASFPIGITAKTWGSNEKKWFVPPVKQILDLRYKPLIKKDKVLIINSLQRVDGGHSYQIIDLQTGIELSRTATEGEFMFLNEKYFIERENDFIRCFDPFSGKEFWKISSTFKNAQINAIGNQISIQHNFKATARSVLIIDANSGKTLKNFELNKVTNDALTDILLIQNNEIWLHFNNETYKIEEERGYDYWIGYDELNKKALWRTDKKSICLGSLINLIPTKFQSNLTNF